MNDQISRQKLKPCPFCGGDKIRLTNWGLYRCWCANCLAQAADEISEKDAVEAWNRRTQPPADPWIPCSKRLPKEDGKYLVTIHGTCSIATDTLYFNVDRQEWCEHDDLGFKHTYCNITAWMPLPEPYKGEENV